MQAKVLKVHPADNVIVALTDLPKGELIAYENDAYVLADNVPQKHKFVTQDLAVGGEITMYGVLVGKATQPIPRGGLIHTHNVKHAASDYFGKEKEYTWSAPDVSRWQGRTFMGYHRPDGRVGTANYWLFVPTVFCENRNLEVIREALQKELGYGQSEKYKNYTRQLVQLYQSGQSPEACWAPTWAARGAIQHPPPVSQRGRHQVSSPTRAAAAAPARTRPCSTPCWPPTPTIPTWPA
jgi:altronate hydrolase